MRKELVFRDLKKLDDYINRQDFVSDICFFEKCITVYLNYHYNKTGSFTVFLGDEYYNDPDVLNIVSRLKKKYELVRYKTNSNIEKNDIDDYINTLISSRKIPAIPDSMDRAKLFSELVKRKDEILKYIDDNTLSNIIVCTIQNMLLTSIVFPFNKDAGLFLLFYTLISPVSYTLISDKIDKFKNKRKFNSLVEDIKDFDIILKPNLNLLCLISREVYELQCTSGIDFSIEIASLRKIAEEYYKNNKLNDSKIDEEILDELCDILMNCEEKKNRSKTVDISEYRNRKNNIVQYKYN